MPKNPTPQLIRDAGYRSIRQFAIELAQTHPQEFQLSGEARLSQGTLELNLAKLFKGRELVWWRNRPKRLAVVAQMLNVAVSRFDLEQDQVPHLFTFESFPDLPALNLAFEEPYSVGESQLITDQNSRPPGWKNLYYWLLGDGTIASPRSLDWLQIEDPTEFALSTARLVATSRHTTLSVTRPGEVGGPDAAVLQHLSPLILSVKGKIDISDLLKLNDRAQKAPLLVISPYSLPSSDLGFRDGATSPGHGLGESNSWRWTFLDGWRGKLVRWIANRLSAKGTGARFNPDSVIAWLDRVDPDHLWFPQTVDVLSICRIAYDHPENALDRIMDFRDIGRYFSVAPKVLPLLEKAVQARWCHWGMKWDAEFARVDWIAAGVPGKHLDSLIKEKMLAESADKYVIADRVLCRLLLRKVIDKTSKMDAAFSWWPSSFDKDRRSLLDATLSSMPKIHLSAVASKMPEYSRDRKHLIGTAEALLVAIGRHLARDGQLTNELKRVGDFVLAHCGSGAQTIVPHSRPTGTINQQFEWITTLWTWQLARPSQSRANIDWVLPGVEEGQVDQKARWLNPWASLQEGVRAVPQGATLDYFIDATCRWSDTLNILPKGEIALLLRPAIIRRSVLEGWRLEWYWWSGLIGEDWAEKSLVRIFTEMNPMQPHKVERLWCSLVEWQRRKCLERSAVFTPGKDLHLPSCRSAANKSSPIMKWVAEHLSDDQVLDVLDDEGKRFVEDHPQWLLTNHKLLALKALSQRPPLKVEPYMVWGYFSAFLPDAADGLTSFLGHQTLGREAAKGLWDWAPDRALDLLSQPQNDRYRGAQALVLSCPSEHLGVAVEALKACPGLLPEAEKASWVYYHLPSSGQMAPDLLKILVGK
ncbi:hypothetical protein [Duganella sp. HH105]|uniref:hypothetical protein n=1 Tax=Duganella sp. HH105 TaxID=1781067 RepID=UPI0008930884|nr:hypothetical protein [Duganella sp. HH105]OEZ59879.1 hypothetical protein DUGA6_35180 [Duganella sp. HH105]